MSNDIASFEKWKEKKKKNKEMGGKKKKMFVRKRQWEVEVEKIKDLEKLYEEFDVTKAETFEEFPLSDKTKKGLEKAGYSKPTAIQQASFTPAIKGRDILGAAKTGSGKTLAFLIPVLECLFRQRWSSIAGPGALIISPTRELAYQTFEVLKKIGQFHDFSAGLVIGGKDVKSESSHMSRTNILICTPGRLLQHMDETSYFDASNLQVLVLDEADRILDLGFKATLNAVIENLPTEKQTLLFSATQTKSVKDLARLSLRDPAYVSVHEKSRSSTPAGLNQKYVVCKLENKLNMLFSFVKTHLKTKTLVFLSSCKQVQYVFAAFCKLRPGVPILMLHGKMNQMRRMAAYDEFCRKQFALLFCTDIAARGLDFPSVDWVLQLDCPEDAETYIHRAGRTARYHGEGHALLVLLESEEEAMVQQLQDRKVPISKTEINTEKFTNINSRLESFCAADLELKQRAQRCFVSYIRSVFLMKNKSVFSVQSLPLAGYSQSLGLAVTPRVRFLQKHEANKNKNKTSVDENSNMIISNNNHEKEAFSGLDTSENDVGDMFQVKKKDVFNLEDDDSENGEKDGKPSKDKTMTNVGAIKKLLKKKYKYNQKILFDEKGELVESWPPVDPKIYSEEGVADDDNSEGLDIEKAKIEMQERDAVDRQRHKEKVKLKHQEKRHKDKEMRRQLQAKKEGRSYKKDEEEVVAHLGDSQQYDDSEDENSDLAETFSVDADIEEQFSRKRTLDDFNDRQNDSPKKTKLKTNTLSDIMIDSGFSLEDDEQLALHLLRK
ncbi:putative ATP-dependent RNA helicase DDX10 [Styela clava]